jgi:hypothetical protein
MQQTPGGMMMAEELELYEKAESRVGKDERVDASLL